MSQSISTASTRISAPEYDERTGKLLALLGQLDAVGLPGELAASRALRDRAEAVERAHGEVMTARTASRDQLLAAVVDGSRSLADAASELAVADVGAASADLMQRAVRVLRGQAVAAVRVDGMATHKALAGRVQAAVRVAVDAGNLLIDVKGVAAALKPPLWDRWRGGKHPWVDAPPRLPDLTLEAITGDPAKVQAWAAGSQAVKDIDRLFEVARALHQVWGGSSRLFPDEVDSNVAYLVDTLAEPVRLAVCAELGWRPGLHLDLKPAAPQAPSSLTDRIIAGIRWPAEAIGIGKAPAAGPYHGGGRPRE